MTHDALFDLADDVHVWWVRLDAPSSGLEAVDSHLSSQERARFSQLRVERTRRERLRARAVLRHLLGRYCDVAAPRLVFSYAPSGKPSLAWPRDRRRVTFNVSHAAEMMCLAVAADRELGVDIEQQLTAASARRLQQWFGIPRSHEAKAPVSPEALLCRWVQQEARLKGLGTGWTAMPDPRGAVAAPAHEWPLEGWHEQPLIPPDGSYRGHLVIQGPWGSGTVREQVFDSLEHRLQTT